jgi:hypothetical protein
MAETEKPITKKELIVTGPNGGRREGSGRKPFVPTTEDRKRVEAMAGWGVPREQIAALIANGISLDTLDKYFKDELLCGVAKANAKVGQTFFSKCVDERDTTSIIWWTKTRMGAKDTSRIEHVSPDGTMSPKGLDVSGLSDSALAEIMEARKLKDADNA